MLEHGVIRLIEISIMISPLILILLALRRKVFRKLGKTARLLLWVPLLLQLAIPIQRTSMYSPYQKRWRIHSRKQWNKLKPRR